MCRPHLHLPGRCYRQPEHLSAQSTEGPQIPHVVGHVRFLHVSCWHTCPEDCLGNTAKECAHRYCGTHLHEYWRPRHLYCRAAPRPTRISSNTPKTRLEQASQQDLHRLIYPSPLRSPASHRLHHLVLLHPQPDPQICRPVGPTRRNPVHDDLQRRVLVLAATVLPAAPSVGQ